METERQEKLPLHYIFLYALAWAGGTVAYTPFITVLLPVKINDLIGTSQGIIWSSYITFFGAIAASIGAILFGYLSDITRNRPIWIGCGMALSGALLIATGFADTLVTLISIIIIWQFALNMMLAPLAAYAADNIPDSQKGLLGGLLAFAPGIGALSATIATHPGVAEGNSRLWLVLVFVIVLVSPILLWSRNLKAQIPKNDNENGSAFKERRAIAIRMWFARFAIQIAEAALFSYLFFWLKTINSNVTDNQTAHIFTFAMVFSAPLALFAGRWADKSGKPIFLLAIFAAISSLCLICMALSSSYIFAIVSYGCFGVISSAFLALHTAQTLSVLPHPNRRGRDLGIFNLTNTLPSIILPVITLGLVPKFGFITLFVLLSVLSAIGSAVLLSVKISK